MLLMAQLGSSYNRPPAEFNVLLVFNPCEWKSVGSKTDLGRCVSWVRVMSHGSRAAVALV